MMGWSDPNKLRSRLFGNIIDNIFWSSHCPVAVMRLLEEPINIHQILVPIKNITPQSIRTIRFAQLFAETNQANITLLHISDRGSTKKEIHKIKGKIQASLNIKIYELTDKDILNPPKTVDKLFRAKNKIIVLIIVSSFILWTIAMFIPFLFGLFEV